MVSDTESLQNSSDETKAKLSGTSDDYSAAITLYLYMYLARLTSCFVVVATQSKQYRASVLDSALLALIEALHK